MKVRMCILGIWAVLALNASCDSEPPAQRPRDVVTIEIPRPNDRCRVANRSVPCTSVGTVMRKELQISNTAIIELRIGPTVRYELVGSVIEALHDAGYVNVRFGQGSPGSDAPNPRSTP